MQIISHRGYWKTEEEKNTKTAFKRSFKLGFGTETDIRDSGSTLVISHDIPLQSAMNVEDFFDLYQSEGQGLPLALNIKSDGLQTELKRMLSRYEIQNYFVFDMSVPDGLRYLADEFQMYTRQSEYEKEPSFYHQAQGVWLDEFNIPWICSNVLDTHLENHKRISIVSPELHGRDHRERWSLYQKMPVIKSDKVCLCTDYPEEAKEFFNG